MVFFPSYKMMEQVCDVFLEKCQSDPSCETETLIQQPGMKEEERESFTGIFGKIIGRAERIAGCILCDGRYFRGRDRPENEQLIGAIVVGTGLPQISNERRS